MKRVWSDVLNGGLTFVLVFVLGTIFYIIGMEHGWIPENMQILGDSNEWLGWLK